MDIQAEKSDLIKWLADVTDPFVIKSFIALKNGQTNDWWDQISAEEKDQILLGLEQAETGELIPHDEVMSKYNEWRSK